MSYSTLILFLSSLKHKTMNLMSDIYSNKKFNELKCSIICDFLSNYSRVLGIQVKYVLFTTLTVLIVVMVFYGLSKSNVWLLSFACIVFVLFLCSLWKLFYYYRVHSMVYHCLLEFNDSQMNYIAGLRRRILDDKLVEYKRQKNDIEHKISEVNVNIDYFGKEKDELNKSLEQLKKELRELCEKIESHLQTHDETSSLGLYLDSLKQEKESLVSKIELKLEKYESDEHSAIISICHYEHDKRMLEDRISDIEAVIKDDDKLNYEKRMADLMKAVDKVLDLKRWNKLFSFFNYFLIFQADKFRIRELFMKLFVEMCNIKTI